MLFFIWVTADTKHFQYETFRERNVEKEESKSN